MEWQVDNETLPEVLCEHPDLLAIHCQLEQELELVSYVLIARNAQKHSNYIN